ncbi:hypothetical protein, partial [Klebsiella pneumoniae]|uniref:hypothetical protein n=1 Tax=Klebsiella pneumoniae TaxID=573 RepID=UPI001B30B1A2
IQECAACVAFWWLMLVLSCESPLVESLLHLVACPLLLGKIIVRRTAIRASEISFSGLTIRDVLSAVTTYGWMVR